MYYRLFNVLNLLLVGLSLFVLCDFLDILAPILAFVFFNVIRFFILTGAEHCAGLLTTLPLRLPLVHLTARLIFLPLLRQTILASVIVSSVISSSLIIFQTH
jgi:hypothetical protein